MDASPLERLADANGRGFPRLMSARSHTTQRLERCREAMSEIQADPDVSVVLMGSWG
jgi:hypothetical protein